MKRIVMLCLTLSLLASLPAFAQMPNPTAESEWQTYLARHPGLAENPQLLNNPTYLNQHPQLAKWLQEHPAVFRQAREQGMWDHNGAWHDASWWHEHNTDWMYRYHPEWAEHHPEWRGDNDGYFDEQHQWRDRHWWVAQHPEWVKQHHPGWLVHQHAEANHRN